MYALPPLRVPHIYLQTEKKRKTITQHYCHIFASTVLNWQNGEKNKKIILQVKSSGLSSSHAYAVTDVVLRCQPKFREVQLKLALLYIASCNCFSNVCRVKVHFLFVFFLKFLLIFKRRIQRENGSLYFQSSCDVIMPKRYEKALVPDRLYAALVNKAARSRHKMKTTWLTLSRISYRNTHTS